MRGLARMTLLRRTLVPVVLGAMCVSCKLWSPHSEPRRLDFKELATADRIRITLTDDRVVRTVSDHDEIQASAQFIERHSDGWVDWWSGPRAPLLLLNFYQGERYVGGFGLSTSYLVAGSLSQDAPPQEISSFVKRLNLEWPPRY